MNEITVMDESAPNQMKHLKYQMKSTTQMVPKSIVKAKNNLSSLQGQVKHLTLSDIKKQFIKKKKSPHLEGYEVSLSQLLSPDANEEMKS